ncbi:MAG: GHKL domain-containing protein [Gammaproteobacteria bacterium]|nr:GHKL domain-containing protein [Gammaproteobacteria bacterium]
MSPAILETLQVTMLENLPVAILIIDDKGLVHYHNHECSRIFRSELGLNSLVSNKITTWSDDLTSAQFQEAILKLRTFSQSNSSQSNGSQSVQFHIHIDQKQNRHSFNLKMIINPAPDSLESEDSYLLTISPIGKPVAVSSATENSNTLATFKKNFKELKQFSRLSAMREISSSFADKLNQPLTAILSYTQAMQRLYKNNASPDEIDEAMERVVINAEKAGKIVKNIRSQLNANTLTPKTTCMNHLIEESIHLTELYSVNSPIQFDAQYESSDQSLYVDPVQIRQVIFSLLNNAIDAVMDSSVKSPKITLTTRLERGGTHTTERSNYMIEISDNGPGFPQEMQGKIFEPFSTTKEKGIGIGLSMCHHIINLHKGSIEIEQPATLVKIYLPVK